MPNADAIALGKQIKAVRKAMKMTQDQLALKSNVSVKYIANIENGKQNPSFDILSAILHVLPLSLDSVINPNLSEAERECRELESIYLACPPEMRKTLLDATRSLAIRPIVFVTAVRQLSLSCCQTASKICSFVNSCPGCCAIRLKTPYS